MFYNKRKKESIQPQEIPAVKYITRRWINYKKRVAGFLQATSERLSTAKKKTYLVLFCLLFGGGSTMVILIALRKDDNKTRIEKRSMVFTPPVPEQSLSRDSIITKKEYERIKNYRKYILGLNKTKEGQEILDSLLSARPKLLDSIAVFENMYLSQ